MINPTTRHRAALIAAAFLACVMPFTVAACSDSDGAGASRASAGGGTGAVWGACMRDAGFDVQDPDDESIEAGLMSAPSGVNQDAFADAGAACADKAGVRGTSDAEKQKWVRQYAKVESCVRENGYPDFPKQQPGGIDATTYERAEEPEFQEVIESCLSKYSPGTKTQSVG